MARSFGETEGHGTEPFEAAAGILHNYRWSALPP